MSEQLNDDERRRLYWSLLTGLAKEAQDQLCASDRGHDWSPWHRTQLRNDIPVGPVSIEDELVAMNEVVRVKSERRCYNCGKEQFSQ